MSTSAVGSDETVNNTFIFAHVEDESLRLEADLAKAILNTPPLRGIQRVLADMIDFVQGKALGNAFNSLLAGPVDEDMALAALVVARFSQAGGVVWDLCKQRPLKALPMACVVMGRKYVCIGGGPPHYDKMVDIMQTVTYLKDDCKRLYDGRWEHGNAKDRAHSTVRRLYALSKALPSSHRPSYRRLQSSLR